jgi:2-polyprenyl-6-methoxyphenol hydroxylase-like FAD-dependent oxidoreductase
MSTLLAGDYDVIVVGARCAGAATARLLAGAGLHVLLLDRTQLPADTVSTHALMLGGVVQLRRWGLLPAVEATGAQPVDAVDITAGDVSFSAPVREIGGVERLYAPRRIVLDALLADAAVAAGATVRTGMTVRGLLRDSAGSVTGLYGTDAGGTEFAYRSRLLVGADGARSGVARLVEAPARSWTPPTSTCHYAYFAGVGASRYEFAFGPDVAAGAIPSDGGLTCVFASCPVTELAALRRDLDPWFHRTVAAAAPQLADRVRGATRVTGYRGVRGLPNYLRQPWGPGWVLVGDAGYCKDPISAHGMTDAFRDAELAARAAVETLAGGDAPLAMARYADTRDAFAMPFLAATTKLASYAWDADGALELLALMGEVGKREAHFLADLPDLNPAVPPAEPYAGGVGAAPRPRTTPALRAAPTAGTPAKPASGSSRPENRAGLQWCSGS